MQNLFSTSLHEKQNFAAKFFEQALQKNALANAYLLVGSNIADKLDFAKELVMILNCQSNLGRGDSGLFGEAEIEHNYNPPCNECTNCKWISSDTHPATPIFLKPKEDSRKAIIVVDQVKNLQTELSKSSEYYRVVIVPEASYTALNKHSANSLLKVVEEPNPNILFLFFAEDKELVLPTIVSRTQQLIFNSSAQEQEEFSEDANELFEQFYRRLEEAMLSNAFGRKSAQEKLDSIVLAEELAGHDYKVLLEFLELLQQEYSNKLADKEGQDALFTSRVIFAFEQAKNDLKSFVRPKTVFEQLVTSV